MHPALNLDEHTVQKFCESHSIRRLALFGSQAKGTAGPYSDVDLLVDFEPNRVPGLLHMVEASQAAVRFVAGRHRADLQTDQMLLFAVIRAIEVVGETAEGDSRCAHRPRFAVKPILAC